jgi:hypothetical protein
MRNREPRSPFRTHAGRAVVAIVTLGVLAPGGVASVAAPAVRAEFVVGAVVLARAAIIREAVPETIDVLARDVSRGFVDVPELAQLTILNTSPAGFALAVLPSSPLLAGIDVRGADDVVSLDASGGEIIQRGSRGADIHLSLGFRFALATGVVPGRYAWPVTLVVRPLTPD